MAFPQPCRPPPGRSTAATWMRTRYAVPRSVGESGMYAQTKGRFFGDYSSLARFLDPLGGDEDYCLTINLLPFGSTDICRLMSTFECDDGCEYLDDTARSWSVEPHLFRCFSRRIHSKSRTFESACLIDVSAARPTIADMDGLVGCLYT